MESKISIETNDNFQNFLLLLLSEFESKKIQEDLNKVKKIDEYTFNIIISEGKYHQIRRLVIYNKNTVVSLQRIRIGEYLLSNLEENELKQFNLGDD